MKKLYTLFVALVIHVSVNATFLSHMTQASLRQSKYSAPTSFADSLKAFYDSIVSSERNTENPFTLQRNLTECNLAKTLKDEYILILSHTAHSFREGLRNNKETVEKVLYNGMSLQDKYNFFNNIHYKFNLPALKKLSTEELFFALNNRRNKCSDTCTNLLLKKDEKRNTLHLEHNNYPITVALLHTMRSLQESLTDTLVNTTNPFNS